MRKLYLLLILFVILQFSLFKSGFVLILDTIFFPLNTLDFSIFWKFIFENVLNLINYLIWYEIYSKLLFFIVVLFYWLFWLQFWDFIVKDVLEDKKLWKLVPILTMSFFLINPFFYERTITQLWVWLGFLFYFYWWLFFLKYLKNQTIKNILISAIFFGLAINMMLQAVFFIFLFSLLVITFYFKKLKNVLTHLTVWIWIVVLLNISFLLSIFSNNQDNIHIKSINAIDQQNLQVFIPNWLDKHSVQTTSLLLYWFWGERYSHIWLPYFYNPNWFVAWLLILIIILFGYWNLLKNPLSRKYATLLIFLWIISYILGVWIASPIWWKLVQLLYDNVPFYVWLRDSHKRMGLLVFVYGFWFWIWVYHVYNYFTQKYNVLKNYHIWIIISIMLLFARTPSLPFSYRNQLKVVNYPSEYFTAKQKLSDQINSKAVVFPWHSYIACDWTFWKIISNPINWLFSPIQAITADNIEIWTIYTNNDNPQSKDIESFLKDYNKIDYLKRNWITHIINLKTCADFSNYSFLRWMNSIENVYSSSKIDLFKIK